VTTWPVSVLDHDNLSIWLVNHEFVHEGETHSASSNN
jgi:hypothetical protein